MTMGWMREEATAAGDGTARVSEVRRWEIDSAFGLRSRRNGDPLQGLGVHEPRLWLFDPHRQRRSHLWEEDRAQTLSGSSQVCSVSIPRRRAHSFANAMATRIYVPLMARIAIVAVLIAGVALAKEGPCPPFASSNAQVGRRSTYHRRARGYGKEAEGRSRRVYAEAAHPPQQPHAPPPPRARILSCPGPLIETVAQSRICPWM